MWEKVRCVSVLSLVILIFFTGLCLAAPLGKDRAANNSVTRINNTNDVIRIGWIYSMANAPLIIADKKGYFKDENIKVVLKKYTSGPAIKKDMKEGRLDIAYMGVPPVFKWYPNGVKTRIIAKVNYGQAAVIVHKDSTINRISDLRGKKFAGVRVYSGMDILLRGFVLKADGVLDPSKDIKITTMKPEKMGEAVEQKKVAGAFSWEPFTSKYLLRGKTKIIFDMSKEYPGYPWYVIMAAPDAVKNKRTELIKVLKAHIKAVNFLNSSPVAGDKLIIQAFGLKAVKKGKRKWFPPEEILVLAKQRIGWQAKWTRRDTQFMQKVMNQSYKLGYINKKVNVNDIIDVSFLFEALFHK